jgi:hypothetical protein
MSNSWSSFEDDKKYIDAWREYLTEDEKEETSGVLEEGFLDRVKTAGAAAKAAWGGHKLTKQYASGKTARAARAAAGYAMDDAPNTRRTELSPTGSTEATGSAEAPTAPVAPGKPPQIQMPDAPVALFTGDGALYSKLFSTIMARFKNKEVAGSPIQLDKTAVQNTVKQILKDLSAQLRANGFKVQESTIPMLADLIVEELERTLLVEASKTSRRRDRDYARSLKGSNMGTAGEKKKKKKKKKKAKAFKTHTSTATAGHGKPANAAEKWIAAGKPEITRVSGNNLVTRDADHYANAKKGTLKPAALEFAKAQVAWLQQNKPDQSIPDMLAKAIEITSADPQAKNYGGDKTGTGSRVAPRKGQVDAGRAVGGKITALIGQAAGADVQDREMRKMVTADIQQDLKAIIMKVVKPHLQKHLQSKGIKLREKKRR